MLTRPAACEVCGLDLRYSHSHHRVPLSLQFDLGLAHAGHAHDRLCPVHHRHVHMLISVEMSDTNAGAFLDCIPDRLTTEWDKVYAVFGRGKDLFHLYGGAGRAASNAVAGHLGLDRIEQRQLQDGSCSPG